MIIDLFQYHYGMISIENVILYQNLSDLSNSLLLHVGRSQVVAGHVRARGAPNPREDGGQAANERGQGKFQVRRHGHSPTSPLKPLHKTYLEMSVVSQRFEDPRYSDYCLCSSARIGEYAKY